MEFSSKKKRVNYRHFVCVGVTVAFLCLLIFYFTDSIGRIIEACRDFGISIAYYFVSLFVGEASFDVTVTSAAKTPFFDFLGDYSSPAVSLPETWDSFKVLFVDYWKLWASMYNFLGYCRFLGNFLYYLLYLVLIALPIVLVFFLVFRFLGHGSNNDYGKDSFFLRFGKKFMRYVCLPVKYFFVDLRDFVREHRYYFWIWVGIWVVNFNLSTIVLEFFAYYFYFIVSFDVLSIYYQFYKLFLDLWTPLSFIPVWLWFVIVVYFVNRHANKKGVDELRHRERMNRGFLNERGVVTIVYGSMGAGKTALITDMALSAEVELRDQALEIIVESDMKFPAFCWVNLEQELKRAFEFHEAYDVWSVKDFIHKKYVRFMNDPCPEKIFGYDFCRSKNRAELNNRLNYYDGLKTVSIWQVIEDYACAYLIYTRQCSLLISNYSIRTDNIMSDLGNFPMWDSDFFRSDPRLMDSFSRHSHILDYDMLRLGKVMNEANPNRFAYGYGVYVITEIDKERKNSPELSSVKRDSYECNQKNDLFNSMLKMSRHGVVIANRVFVKIIADLQRPSSLGADARELGEIVYIKDRAPMDFTLPRYSPFYALNVVFGWLDRHFTNYYMRYRFNRGDNTLFCSCFKWLASKFEHYRERVTNTYSSEMLILDVESGSMDGKSFERRYFRQSKKIWSDRYATDCLSGIFETRGELNTVGIDDLCEYVSNVASSEELKKQNSHFQYEIDSILESE